VQEEQRRDERIAQIWPGKTVSEKLREAMREADAHGIKSRCRPSRPRKSAVSAMLGYDLHVAMTPLSAVMANTGSLLRAEGQRDVAEC
jgi:hypothetical protein